MTAWAACLKRDKPTQQSCVLTSPCKGEAHGALTWGVLDRLLQDEYLEIAVTSGTSAGALNAADLKSGMLAGASEGACASLDALWAEVACSSSAGMGQWFEQELYSPAMLSRALELSPVYAFADVFNRMTSAIRRDCFIIIRCNPLWMVWIMVTSAHLKDRICSSAPPTCAAAS